ncbi:Fur family transcriptional regulator [Glaciibacter psychrotolerans]|uniref:Fur family ferric uptake transcriptional regulator n=1 Tax=Glaciibacter psychrotolerans TaxID=670054 RepID=A0A7Z0EEQ9_9MICO|nr:Fur family transcriptional regulator [Leifsonia psychrotolerans]NYJ20146.1 Fur family ferric uptake transcriptional regulator [Leifsonia psychrotolerans]
MKTVEERQPADSFADSIHAVDLKVTATRLAVLAALSTRPHSSAEVMFEAVSRELPATSMQAVYGVLAAFTAAGLVRRIEPAGSAALYERRVGDNHHHLVCTRCTAVHDVDCAVGEAPCLTPAQSTGSAAGFVVHEAEVTFWGLCASCQAATSA